MISSCPPKSLAFRPERRSNMDVGGHYVLLDYRVLHAGCIAEADGGSWARTPSGNFAGSNGQVAVKNPVARARKMPLHHLVRQVGHSRGVAESEGPSYRTLCSESTHRVPLLGGALPRPAAHAWGARLV